MRGNIIWSVSGNMELSKKKDQESGIMYEFLCKLILGGIRNHSNFFITEEDLVKIKRSSIASVFLFLTLSLLLCFLTKTNIGIAITISFVAAVAFLFVFGDYVRSTILKKHQEFDESAFLILNALSINIVSTQSFPHAIDFLVSNGISNKYYNEYFTEMIYNLNIGEYEDQVIGEGKRIFLNNKYQNAFQNIKNEERFIESDPDFLLRVKKEIKLIEDNIVIFVAVSCLLPLVLSMVLALIIPPESLTIFIFPLLYALFGIFTLRFVQNRSLGGLRD